MPYERCAGIRERSYGTLEGETRRITEGLTTEQRNQLYTMFGVEQVEPLRLRMYHALMEIMQKEDHQSINTLCFTRFYHQLFFVVHRPRHRTEALEEWSHS